MRRLVAKISVRLLAFNLLLVFLPAAAITYLEIYEQKLLQAQEASMVQQGRLLAAALAERGGIVPAEVESILEELQQRTPSRIRVVDSERRLVADSSRLGPKRELAGSSPSQQPGPRTNALYRLGSFAFRLFDRIVSGARPRVGGDFYSADRPFDGTEIDQALSGQYGAATRITPGGQRSVTLFSALPVRNAEEVVGVVLVSQSTFSILQDLYEVRLTVFEYLLLAVGVAAVLSLMLSATISRPLERLRAQALAIVDRRGRLTGRFTASSRLDEIGDLSRALEVLSSRLEERMRFIESFAADVSHEFKNPLASIRSAAEILAETEDPAIRRRFSEIVQTDIARLQRLLSEVRAVTELDAEADDAPTEAVSLNSLLRGVAARESYAGLELRLDPAGDARPVAMSPDRLARVVENLLDNAFGFAGSRVRVATEFGSDQVVLLVEDDGPGVAEEDRERVFDRFFTYRPEGATRDHSGLGLAIVKAIVERSGGAIRVLDSPLGGASFELRLGLAAVDSPVSVNA